MACCPSAASGAASGGSSGRTPFRNRKRGLAPCTVPPGVSSCAAADRSWSRIPCCSACRSATWAWASHGSGGAAAADFVLAGPLAVAGVALARSFVAAAAARGSRIMRHQVSLSVFLFLSLFLLILHDSVALAAAAVVLDDAAQ